jgi:hypothetical protein
MQIRQTIRNRIVFHAKNVNKAKEEDNEMLLADSLIRIDELKKLLGVMRNR